MKVHIVTNANKEFYAAPLEQMHRQRHAYFVEEMGWEALRRPDGLEIDEYDDQHAVYLLAMDGEKVEGSLRLLPTWRRSLLVERFPHFVSEGEPPQGPNIWEWTRWAPGSLSRPRALLRARKYLILAALEFARSRGIDVFTAICDMKFLGQMIELGWWPTPLGLPREFGEGTAVALRWEVFPDTLSNTRAILKYKSATAFEAPAFALDESASVSNRLLSKLFSLRPADIGAIEQFVFRQSPGDRKAVDLQTIAMQGNA